MDKTYKIAVVPGDGTGPEVVNEGIKVLNAVGAKCGFDIAGVDDFLKEKENVERIHASTVSLTKADLPKETLIKVLEHQL